MLYAQWKEKTVLWANADSIPDGAEILKYEYEKVTTQINTTGECPSGYTYVPGSKVYSGTSKLVESGFYEFLDPDEYNSKYVVNGVPYLNDVVRGEEPPSNPGENCGVLETKSRRDQYGFIYHFCSASSTSIGAWKHGEYDQFCCNWVTRLDLQDSQYLTDDEDGITRLVVTNQSDTCPRGRTQWFGIPTWISNWEIHEQIFNYSYQKTETITSEKPLSSTENITYTLIRVQYMP